MIYIYSSYLVEAQAKFTILTTNALTHTKNYQHKLKFCNYPQLFVC